ncbi:MAG: hypothetical protein RIS53_550 [Bacillota bacterium]
MTLLALSTVVLIGLLTPLPIQDTVNLTFIILNDDQQKVVTLNQGEFYFNPPNDFILRDNVRLKGWYQDENLTRFHDFDLPIVQDTNVYAMWDYLNPAIALAQLSQSSEGNRFESKTMVLNLPLYQPLQEGVRYQWQAAPQNSADFENIGGANTNHFSPFRNGTFQYRVRYRLPIYNNNGTIIDDVSYYSNIVTITIYGQQTIVGYIIAISLILLMGLIFFLRTKRSIYYVVDGGELLKPGRFYIGEDITLQPKAKKKGYRFIGWFEDDTLKQPFSGLRMPMKAMKLYAKFKKTKTNR